MEKCTPPITTNADAYARRFKQILDYIDKHLDEGLTVEGTAE